MLLAVNGLRISEALGADIGDLDYERGHRTLKILRKGGKRVTIPLAPRTSRVFDLYIGERTTGPIFLGAHALHGGLKPGLLDEVVWWQTDDFWRYSLLAVVALIRASADRQGMSVPELARRLGDHLGIPLE